MLVAVHEPFNHKIGDHVEIDHGHHQSWILSAPAGLLLHPSDDRAQQAAELFGHVVEQVCEMLVLEFDDVNKFRCRNIWDEGYYSRHYVNWMRHMFYRDALKLRLRRDRLEARPSSDAACARSTQMTQRI